MSVDVQMNPVQTENRQTEQGIRHVTDLGLLIQVSCTSETLPSNLQEISKIQHAATRISYHLLLLPFQLHALFLHYDVCPTNISTVLGGTFRFLSVKQAYVKTYGISIWHSATREALGHQLRHHPGQSKYRLKGQEKLQV